MEDSGLLLHIFLADFQNVAISHNMEDKTEISRECEGNVMTVSSFLILMITTGALALMGLVVSFVYVLRRIFVNHGKLPELMEVYPAENRPDGMVFEKQTIGLGRSLRFRKCVTVCISQAGLYLSVKVVFGKRFMLLIPWSEFSKVTETRLYGVKAVSLSIGSPEITSIKVHRALFAKIKPYLKGSG